MTKKFEDCEVITYEADKALGIFLLPTHFLPLMPLPKRKSGTI